jgi:two-component system, OmpR family, response regulator
METKSLRILLVEDDGSIARVITIAMRQLGVPYYLDQAFSGEEGMELWDREPYDLVMTDYNLRGMTGIHMVDSMKAHAPDLPTVLFTAYDDAKVRREAKEAGVTRFITKPFIVEEFIDIARGPLPMNASEMGAPTSSEF